MKALYPGSFDPITNGHIDIIKQALEIFDEVIIGVANNPDKECLFSAEDRRDLILKSLRTMTLAIDCTLIVNVYNGMTVDYAHEVGVKVLVRGLRAVSDFEAEFQMTLFNRKKIGESKKGINTMFFIPDESRVYLSSSAIKGIVKTGGNVDEFVPPIVAKYLYTRFDTMRRHQT